MIEAKDLETLQKISDELAELGYTKPNVTIFHAVNAKSGILMAFDKISAQTPQECKKSCQGIPQ